MRLRSLAAIAALAVSATTANAQPVNVNYVVTGSAGNWLFDFTVSNTGAGAAADLGVYLFGVQIGPTAVASSPANWSQFITWTTSSGSGTTYANTWMTDQSTGIGVGSSLSGFSAHSFALEAPTQVKWFAYAISQTQANEGTWYEGGDNFNGLTYNPAFESTATGTYIPTVIQEEQEPGGNTPVVETPEPSTYVLLASGLFAVGFMTRRRRMPS
jgi:hypothetical protein